MEVSGQGTDDGRSKAELSRREVQSPEKLAQELRAFGARIEQVGRSERDRGDGPSGWGWRRREEKKKVEAKRLEVYAKKTHVFWFSVCLFFFGGGESCFCF